MGPALFGKEEMIHSLYFSASENVSFKVKPWLLDHDDVMISAKIPEFLLTLDHAISTGLRFK